MDILSMSAQVKPINLLPQSEFEASLFGKFLQWAVTSGRYIIIATELVVIVAFLSRFKLDQDLANINSTIEGQKTILVNQQPLEREFRQVQRRLDSAQEMLNRQVKIDGRYTELLTVLPENVKLNSLTFTQTETKMEAVTLSETAIGQLLARIKQRGFWKDLEMTEFSTEDGVEINFTLVMRN